MMNTSKAKNQGKRRRGGKEEVIRLKKIIKVLAENPNGVWMREIARQTKMHPEQVRRIISRHPQIFEEYANFTNYGINLKIIRLKREYKQYLAVIYASNNSNNQK